MDTGSSNGTFVNNIRLSKSGEESKMTEIFSSDILRFGSDIVDKVPTYLGLVSDELIWFIKVIDSYYTWPYSYTCVVIECHGMELSSRRR